MKKILGLASAIIAVAFIVLGVQRIPHVPVVAGAVVSPEISENHISVNGVTTWTLRQNMPGVGVGTGVGSTTLCSFPNPAGAATSTLSNGSPIPTVGTATSTLERVTIYIPGATSTAMTFDVSTTTASSVLTNGTSSPAFVYNVSVPAGTPFFGSYVIAGPGNATSSDARLTSSLPASANGNIIRPNEYVTVQAAGVGVNGYQYTTSTSTAQCTAVFRSMSAF